MKGNIITSRNELKNTSNNQIITLHSDNQFRLDKFLEQYSFKIKEDLKNKNARPSQPQKEKDMSWTEMLENSKAFRQLRGAAASGEADDDDGDKWVGRCADAHPARLQQQLLPGVRRALFGRM